jgi:hypothetical protein
MGTGGLLLGGKTPPGREADHSPPRSAEGVNEYELYILSPCASIGVMWDSFCILLFELSPRDNPRLRAFNVLITW